MNVALWIFFGILAGTVAYLSDTVATRGGFFGNITAGVLGALGGGILASYIFQINTIFDLPTFIIAICFSTLFLFVTHTFLSVSKGEI